MMRSAQTLAVSAVVFLGSACDSGPSAGSGTGSSKVVGVTMQNLTNPFFSVIADHLEKELKPHGYSIDLKSGQDDVATQAKQFKDFFVNNVAAIVVNAKDSKAIGPAVVEANEKGIPVFSVDIRVLDPKAKVVAHVGSDNYGGGKLAGQAMIEALGEAGGKVAILDYEVAESCIEREKGFKEVIDAHNASGAPGKIEVVVELDGGGNKDKGFTSTQDAIGSHPDLAGIFAINDPSALGARACLEKAEKADQVKIIGFDGQPEGKQAIREGKIYADPIQFPDRMGEEIGKAIIKHLNGEQIEAELDIPTELYRQSDALKDPSLTEVKETGLGEKSTLDTIRNAVERESVQK